MIGRVLTLALILIVGLVAGLVQSREGRGVGLAEPPSTIVATIGEIASVKLEAIPEGPPAAPFVTSPGEDELPLADIIDEIPLPLPIPLPQGACSFGGNLIVELSDERRIVYGPCYRPSEIDRLWGTMVDEITSGACQPQCAPRTHQVSPALADVASVPAAQPVSRPRNSCER